MNRISRALYFYLSIVCLCYCYNISDEDKYNENKIVNDAHCKLYGAVHELQLFLSEQNIVIHSENIAGTYINWLQWQYIKMADLLWREIEYYLILNDHTIEKSDLLELIRISHAVLLNGNFRENSIDLNLFDPYDEILFDCILKVNSLIDIAKQTFLIDENLMENELSILSVVQDHFELKKILDDIHGLFTTNVKYFEEVS